MEYLKCSFHFDVWLAVMPFGIIKGILKYELKNNVKGKNATFW